MTRREESGSLRIVATLLVSALLIVVAGTGIGAFASGATLGGVGGDAGETDAHLDPEAIESGSDLSAIERRLVARAAERIRSGAIQVSEGDVERARSALGDEEFERLVDQYGAVANRTGSASRARAIRRTQRLQLAYTAQVERYRTAYGQYLLLTRSAGPAGTSDEDPRRLARRMGTISRTVNDTATRLIESYQALPGNRSQGSRNATAAIRATRAEIVATQAAVRRAEFVPTRVRITSATETISFTRPLRVTGRLTTANGTAVANESITVAILEANRSVTTTTDRTGTFAFDYRPRTLPRNTTDLTLRYEPAPETAYAGNRTSIDVTVEQSVPTVRLSRPTGPVTYNETLIVDGHVSANGTGVPDAPYVFTLGTQVVVRGETDPVGRFVVRERVSPEIDAGERRIEVIFPFGNRTLATATGATNVTVASEPTRLALSAEGTDGRVVRVSGRLTTADGVPVGGVPVRLRVASAEFGTVSTDRSGRFSTRVTIPRRLTDSGLLDRRVRVPVEAVYENGGSLEPARETTRATVTEPVPWAQVGGGLGVLAVVGVVYLLYSRAAWRGRGSTDGDGRGGTGETGGTGGSAASRTPEAAPGPDSLLTSAREHLDAGRPDVAVALGYEALRRRLAPESPAGGDRARTHWEFYRACREREIDEAAVEALSLVTELYERATFAGEPLDAETVRAGLDRVAAVSGTETGAGAGPATASGSADATGAPGTSGDRS